jgi:hypothetical protein
MISEPKTAAEKGTFRCPALVSLPPKRRFRAHSGTIFEHNEAGEWLAPIISPVGRRQKLKRSGRLVLRWVDPQLLPAVAQAASYPPYPL